MLNISQKNIKFAKMESNMKPIRIKILAIATIMVFATHMSLASFTGNSEKKSSSIFSLKDFNKSFYRSTSSLSLRVGFVFKGLQVINHKRESNGDITINSMMRFEKGNTTYIYPYRHKVSSPKFRTPTAELR